MAPAVLRSPLAALSLTNHNNNANTKPALQACVIRLRYMRLYVAFSSKMVAVTLPLLLVSLFATSPASALYPFEDVEFAPGFVLPPLPEGQQPLPKPVPKEIDLVSSFVSQKRLLDLTPSRLSSMSSITAPMITPTSTGGSISTRTLRYSSLMMNLRNPDQHRNIAFARSLLLSIVLLTGVAQRSMPS